MVYNYYNLNDVEFENLCKDIMERMILVAIVEIMIYRRLFVFTVN